MFASGHRDDWNAPTSEMRRNLMRIVGPKHHLGVRWNVRQEVIDIRNYFLHSLAGFVVAPELMTIVGVI